MLTRQGYIIITIKKWNKKGSTIFELDFPEWIAILHKSCRIILKILFATIDGSSKCWVYISSFNLGAAWKI